MKNLTQKIKTFLLLLPYLIGNTITAQDCDIEIFYTVQKPLCFGEASGSIVIDAVTGGTPPYEVQLVAAAAQNAVDFINLPADNYEITAEDAAGCQITVPVFVAEPPGLFVEAGESQMILAGETVELAAVTTIQSPAVQWSPSSFVACRTCLTTEAFPAETTVYQITVADENGCSATDSLQIIVDDEVRIYIPNAFSPDKDGINDRFFVFGDESAEQINSLLIFDRKGSGVFQAQNMPLNVSDFGWDGTMNGKPLNAGVYAYIIEILRFDGVTERRTGTVTLVR